jgi:hypothetical protein
MPTEVATCRGRVQMPPSLHADRVVCSTRRFPRAPSSLFLATDKICVCASLPPVCFVSPGSERVSKTEVTGDALKEAQHINKYGSWQCVLGSCLGAWLAGCFGPPGSCFTLARECRYPCLRRECLCVLGTVSEAWRGACRAFSQVVKRSG